MREPDILPYLDDIKNESEHISAALKRMTYEEFLADSLYHSAIIRYLEVIGEAVKHIPDSIRSAYPDVPWRKIAGMRDVLIHDYVNVNLIYVWQVATVMVPLLYRRVLNIIDTIEHMQ